jgi:serine/threonine protein kinase
MSKHGEEAPEEEHNNKEGQAEQLFEIGECVRRWVITTRIGGGAFGETYTGVDCSPESRGAEVCIKAEKQDKRPILRTEVLALKRAQDCPNVVRYISSGKHNNVNFLVMEKLGENLADVRRRCPRGIMDLYSAIQYTIACLSCIEQVHSAGLVHRDIKPSNFVLGPPGCVPYTVYIIDFGLAKRYVSTSGEIKPPRENAGFRGTSRYASINSHLQKDLGRVDDLWSLLFMAVEYITGTLPWRRVKEKDAIGALKQQHVGPQLVRYLPREMTDFVNHLMRLDYGDRPDYAMLRALLYTTITRKGLVAPPTVAAQAPATAPLEQQPHDHSPAPDDTPGPNNRNRRGIIVNSEPAGADVILQLQSPAAHNDNRKPPLVNEKRLSDDSILALEHGASAASPREPPPGSPIILEMGSMVRSGAGTPAAVNVVNGNHSHGSIAPASPLPQPATRKMADNRVSIPPKADEDEPESEEDDANDEPPVKAFSIGAAANSQPHPQSLLHHPNVDHVESSVPVLEPEFDAVGDVRAKDDEFSEAKAAEDVESPEQPATDARAKSKGRRRSKRGKEDDPACCCAVA